MKRRLQYYLFIILPLLTACSDMAYDMEKGVNKDITLFQEEISAPLGSVGPITVGSLLDKLGSATGMGDLLDEMLTVEEDGALTIEYGETFYTINAYEVERQLPDPSVAQEWSPGDQYAMVGGIGSLLGMFGMQTVNQHIQILGSNPLRDDVPVTCTAKYSYMDGDETKSVDIPELSSFTLYDIVPIELVTLDIPKDITSTIDDVSMEDLKFSLPANPASNIFDNEDKVFFSLDFKYKCGLAAGEDMELSLDDISTGDISLPVGEYQVKKCIVFMQLESTVPLAIGVSNIRAIDKEDVVINADFTLAGGTKEHPAITEFEVSIEALEGTIPDINEVMLDLKLSAQPGLGPEPITADQGILLKSSSAKLLGGITIHQKK